MILLAAEAAQQSSPLGALPLFLLMGVALYFIMIRPQKKRMQQQQSLLRSLEVGNEVLTIGGVFGVIRHIDEEGDELTIEVAPGSTLRIVKSAVARIVDVDEETTDDDGPWFEEDSESESDSDGSEAGEEK